MVSFKAFSDLFQNLQEEVRTRPKMSMTSSSLEVPKVLNNYQSLLDSDSVKTNHTAVCVLLSNYSLVLKSLDYLVVCHSGISSNPINGAGESS